MANRLALLIRAMARFDTHTLDEVIHGRMRLGIMAYLIDAGEADFVTLKKLLGATQGNLSVHLKKLEEAGYIALTKAFENRKPVTRAKLTAAGRKAFDAYLQALGELLAG